MGEKGPCLETVRALHKTVVALRAALEESQQEILKLKVDQHADCDDGNVDTKRRKFDTRISIKSRNNRTKSLESLTILKSNNRLKLTKNCSLSNLSIITNTNNNNNKRMNEHVKQQLDENDQDQEVDDIELIFTTDETKDADFKEQLVSIEQNDTNLLQCPGSDLDSNFDNSDRELDDDVFNDNSTPQQQQHSNNNNNCMNKSRNNSQIYNSKSDNSINHDEKSLKSCYSYQDSSFENKSLEKDESFDHFDDQRVRIIETDISKCGIQDVDYCTTARRNTCPNPLQYRPLVHREAIGRGLNVQRKTRPILVHSNAIRKESGAQTDISALPAGSGWLSESNLANKSRAGENFTTLPSKFPLPGSRLKLSEKTVEARRVLLSDIGFTSMVPELSRSADHLCPSNAQQQQPPPPPPVVTTYGQFLRTTDYQSPNFTSQRFTWTTTATTTVSPSDRSPSQLLYPLPSPPVLPRRCSAPVSPSKRAILRPTTSKVRFANGSLPELRSDWTLGQDSGDSTDSLVEEAENYLRRSIDCLITSREREFYSNGEKKSSLRRASAPEPSGDNVPPQGWQPFLPRSPRDLKPDHWVKVITPEGRVRGGRVRYIGPVITQTDHFVGVQLGTPEGSSDGTYNNRRYFQCEPYHGIFVPFKKVIMGWRP